MSSIPFVEKYRPKKLCQIIQQTEAMRIFNAIVKTGHMPHLLLYGPPGTGKTSTVLALAFELFGPKNFCSRVMELNASDDRGINVVRDKIIAFARTKISNGDPGYPSPEIKLIILDEADAMTTEGQSALRAIIESSSHITRFCLICNYIDKIIDPIVSRCQKIRFKAIEPEYMIEKLKVISLNEKISIDDKALEIVCKISEGDARRAIMILQHVKYLNKSTKIITSKDIEYITYNVDEDLIDEILSVSKTYDILSIQKCAKKIKRNAYPIPNILDKIKNKIFKEKISDFKKSLIIEHLANAEATILMGGNEYLQVLNVIVKIAEVFN